jgi:positive phototaxis protein PixI
MAIEGDKLHSASTSQLPAASAERDRQQYLKFSIQPGLMALIEIECVSELMDIPLDRVVPMPHLPPAVKGIYNWRGEILWIVDLCMLLGLGGNYPSRSRRMQPTIMMSSSAERSGAGSSQSYGLERYATPTADTLERRGAKTIGVIVDEIVDIEWCQIDLIRSVLPEQLQPELATGVLGMWTSTVGENFLVLDGRAILERADLHADV